LLTSEVRITDDFHLIFRLHSKLSDLKTQVIDLAGIEVHFVFDRSDQTASAVMY
jgi:hypothetical protein